MLISRLLSTTTRFSYRRNTSFYNIQKRKLNEKQINGFPCIATRFFSVEEDTNSSSDSENHGPTLEEVLKSSLTLKNASNETIIRLAADEVPAGCMEHLKRHIMVVESIQYPEACKKVEIIKEANSNISSALALPNKAGFITAIAGGFISFPLCFHEPTVHWFNEKFVTADIPEPKDLETWLEVGSWAWNWMEPIMGQLSFLLLCLAFARSQFQTLGITPYSKRIKDERANTLVKMFPDYDKTIISAFSKSQPFDWYLIKLISKKLN